MKQNMHKPDFTGMTAPGVFEGPPHLLFRAGVPDNMEIAPPFNLKVVDAAERACVLARYNAVHCRLASLYPLDLERQERAKSKWLLPTDYSTRRSPCLGILLATGCGATTCSQSKGRRKRTRGQMNIVSAMGQVGSWTLLFMTSRGVSSSTPGCVGRVGRAPAVAPSLVSNPTFPHSSR
ncbi:unnamed protein product [Sphacelaria rigidula]